MSRKKQNKRYTPEFKELVVEPMMEEKLSYCEAARRFENLPAHSRDFTRELAGRKWSEMLIFSVLSTVRVIYYCYSRLILLLYISKYMADNIHLPTWRFQFSRL